MTEKLHSLLGEQKERNRRKWTVAKISESIYCGRCHITAVLANQPGRGGKTRKKLVTFFKREFPETWPLILEELSWDETGKLIEKPVSHMEHST